MRPTSQRALPHLLPFSANKKKRVSSFPRRAARDLGVPAFSFPLPVSPSSRYRGLTTIRAPAAAGHGAAHERNPTSSSIATSCSTDSFRSVASTPSSSSHGSCYDDASSSSASSSLSRASSFVFGDSGSSGSLSTAPSSTGSSTPAALDEKRQQQQQLGSEPVNCLLTSAWAPEDVLLPGRDALIPAQLPTAGVSFRHFRMQPAKFASISDVVIYSPDGGFSKETVDLARRTKRALKALERERVLRGDDECLEYEVYVVAGECHTAFLGLVGSLTDADLAPFYLPLSARQIHSTSSRRSTHT